GQTAIDRWVRVGTLRVGGFEASGFDLAVMDLHALTHSFGTRVDGVLGYGTFAGGVVTFDFPAGALRVEAAALPPPDGDTVLGVRSPTRPLVPLEVSGRVFPVLFDTGQRAAFVVDALDAMDVVAPPRATGFALGTDGRSLTRSARLDGDVRL